MEDMGMIEGGYHAYHVGVVTTDMQLTLYITYSISIYHTNTYTNYFETIVIHYG